MGWGQAALTGVWPHPNKLSRTQYADTTWGARTWMSFQAQRLLVCLHKAVAFELNAERGHCTGPLY